MSAGETGGGALLTDEAREFLEKYKIVEEGLREIVDERFRHVFRR